MNEVLIESLLQEMGSHHVRSNGANVYASCPLASWTHAKGKDTGPSFSIAVNGAGDSPWKCWACGEVGKSARSLLWKFKSLSGQPMGQWRALADPKANEKEKDGEYRPRVNQDQPMGWGQGGAWFKTDRPDVIFDFKDFEPMCGEIPQYAFDRGITVEQAVKWKLGYDRKRHRLFIPIFDETGKMVGYSGRAIHHDQQPKYKHAAGFRRETILYGEQFVNRNVKRAFLSEGFMDVWALDRQNIPNAFAFFGTGVGSVQLIKLAKWDIEEVVLLPHNDKPDKHGVRAGDEAAKRWSAALRECGIRPIVAPQIEGKKDVGDWTPEEIQAMLRAIENVKGI